MQGQIRAGQATVAPPILKGKMAMHNWRRKVLDRLGLILKVDHEAQLQSENDRHHKDCEAQRKTLQKHHAAEMAAAQASARRIVDNHHDIRFDRLGYCGDYVVSVAFDRRLIGGLGYRDDLQMIASYVGERVEAEIASSRFLESGCQAAIALAGGRDQPPVLIAPQRDNRDDGSANSCE